MRTCRRRRGPRGSRSWQGNGTGWAREPAFRRGYADERVVLRCANRGFRSHAGGSKARSGGAQAARSRDRPPATRAIARRR
ncbi:protein of unknown function [Methylorubrum extorquens DM4]|uniref:Uncharacterized protein n=1 Tax=Methylorubrum extorquens (strain DSM 6343 / CIP 106787 / DM4) TaxID=661410 RepID=A0A2P9HAT8_METED|nr:protein of unknown function [Methylorubrum extorquens DM4]